MQQQQRWVELLEDEARVKENRAAEWERMGIARDAQVAPHVKGSREDAASLRAIASYLQSVEGRAEYALATGATTYDSLAAVLDTKRRLEDQAHGPQRIVKRTVTESKTPWTDIEESNDGE